MASREQFGASRPVRGAYWKQPFHLPLRATAKRRFAADRTVLGKPIPSLDRTAVMTGQFEFVHQVRIPGMLHRRVVRPPEMGATVTRLDEQSVRSVPVSCNSSSVRIWLASWPRIGGSSLHAAGQYVCAPDSVLGKNTSQQRCACSL
jgi:hypothetical protein